MGQEVDSLLKKEKEIRKVKFLSRRNTQAVTVINQPECYGTVVTMRLFLHSNICCPLDISFLDSI